MIQLLYRKIEFLSKNNSWLLVGYRIAEYSIAIPKSKNFLYNQGTFKHINILIFKHINI